MERFTHQHWAILQSNCAILVESEKYRSTFNFFIDDDGKNEVLRKLQPLFLSKSVPYEVAVFGNSAIISNLHKSTETLELQNTYGWEVLSHTLSHPILSDLTDEEVEIECKDFFSIFLVMVFKLTKLFILKAFLAIKENIILKYYQDGYLARSKVLINQYVRELTIDKIQMT